MIKEKKFESFRKDFFFFLIILRIEGFRYKLFELWNVSYNNFEEILKFVLFIYISD